MTRFRPIVPIRQAVSSAALASILALTVSSSALAQCAGDNSPVFPVPETRGIVTLWPGNIRPVLPDRQLPASRDSSSYLSTSIPGLNSGHELFSDIDIVNDFAYVSYNAGFQIWDIGGSAAEEPVRVQVKDGWNRDFETFPNAGEADTFVEAIAAHPEGNDVLITVSGRSTVGPSFWRHSSNGTLSRIGQDETRESRDVAMADIGGAIFSFSATSTEGVTVYQAATGQFLGSMGGSVSAQRYVEVLNRGGKLWVVASSGSFAPMKIWEWTPGAAFPAPSQAIERFSGEALGFGVRDVAIFEQGGTAYLAMVYQQTIKIFNVDSCLDANGCASLGNAVWNFSIPGPTPNEQFLTFSRANTTIPFLYYGYLSNSSSGPKKEQLFNLENLGGSNLITEITAGGGTFTDVCGNTVDYWGYYYDENETGYRNFSPRAGVFNGNYFYRVSRAAFDVHTIDAIPSTTPVISTTVTSSPPHWMSTPGFQHPITLSATEQNCSGTNWSWFDDDSLSTVNGSGSSATLTADLCGAGSSCPDRQLEAWASKSECAGSPVLIVNRAAITVQDPRVRINSLSRQPSSAEVPIGTVLGFSADLGGKNPFTYNWELRRSSGEVIETSTAASYVVDTGLLQLGPTCDEDPTCIFKSGFNSGGFTEWTSVFIGGLYTPPRNPTKGVNPEAFTVALRVRNLSNSSESTAENTFTVTPLGPLGFDNPALTVTDLGGGAFRFQANSLNATEWKWTIQDGSNQILDWGVEDSLIEYSWATAGTFQVTVEIRNVETAPGNELSASTSATVSNPLELTSFNINGGASSGCTFLPLNQAWECRPNVAITFSVGTTGSPTRFDFDWDNNGTFEESFNAGATIRHTYSSTGPKNPKVRAVSGAGATAAIGLDQSLTIF